MAEEKSLVYAKELKKLIDVKTISSSENPEEKDFDEFHKTLKEVFPDFFKTVSVLDNEGSLLMKWKGKDPKKEPILFMNHQDVVEAGGSWTHPPFEAVIENGKLYGRGTLDTKGGLYCMLKAADELIAEGYVPERDVYFESSCNEEIMGEGAYEFAKALKDKKVRFKMVLDEGGMMVYDPIGGADVYCAAIGVSEKGIADLKFTARSKGGHASSPEKNSPLVRLGKFMAEVDRNKVFDAELTPELDAFFSGLAPYTHGAMKFIFSHTRLLKPLIEKIVPRVSASGNALFRTTIAFTQAHGSEASNVVPESAYVIGNMRYSHHQGFDSSVRAITAVADKYDVDTEVIYKGYKANLSDFDSDEFRLLEKTITKLFPDVLTVPYIQMSGSDAQYYGLVSDKVFRFVPFRINQEQLESIHGLNENVNIGDLPKAVEFYKEIIKGA